ncbi:MAG TPA: NAD-dependent epimerase/dehydratase family protein, partial [Candidatus Bathyarchaeia archaeon]|nr:NAD-dependent epimerase/dehydratase family protein [Candidatus Bathyarchaeia archaeon]
MAEVAIITGSAGLIGSQAVEFFSEKGFEVVGIDNDMRAYFFGPDASTRWNLRLLKRKFHYTHQHIDIRKIDSLKRIFQKYGKNTALIIHTAAQPSHDWAA